MWASQRCERNKLKAWVSTSLEVESMDNDDCFEQYRNRYCLHKPLLLPSRHWPPVALDDSGTQPHILKLRHSLRTREGTVKGHRHTSPTGHGHSIRGLGSSEDKSKGKRARKVSISTGALKGAQKQGTHRSTLAGVRKGYLALSRRCA